MKKGYWFILGGIVVLWFTSWGLINTYITETNRGAFGDMFGAVNALFSGLALAGVVIAIFMQKEELSLQREELKLTREEMKRQVKAQEGSSEALARQVETMRESAILNALAAGITNCNEAQDLGSILPKGSFVRNPLHQKADFVTSLNKEVERILSNKAAQDVFGEGKWEGK